jgi:predicted phosphatase
MRDTSAISTFEEDGFEVLPDDILYLEDRTIHGWIEKLSKI